jgi:hypothetical protein
MSAKHKIIIDNDEIRLLQPKNDIEALTRDMIKKINAQIKEPHCEICGDTLKDGNLIQVMKVYHFCEMCHYIQFT